MSLIRTKRFLAGENKTAALNVTTINRRLFDLIKPFDGDELKQIAKGLPSGLYIIHHLRGHHGAKIELLKYNVTVLLGMSNIEITMNNNSKNFSKDDILKDINSMLNYLENLINDDLVS